MFLTAVLVAVCAAVVITPAAVTKKGPPATPTGTFYVDPLSSISVTGMTLKSDDQVGVMVLVGDLTSYSGYEFMLGSNTDALGEEITLADWSYTNDEYVYPVPVRLVLVDLSAVLDADTNTVGAAYFSDGTFKDLVGGSPILPGSHVTVGAGDKGQILVSMNDGSVNPTGVSEPELGAGNFNASVSLTAPKAPAATITSIAGFSDGPVDVAGVTKCSYHVEFKYTVNKAKLLAGAAAYTVLSQGDGLGPGIQDTLTASPFTGSSFLESPNLSSGGYYFTAMIGQPGNFLAVRSTTMFQLDSTKYDSSGCPKAGQIISTDFVG